MEIESYHLSYDGSAVLAIMMAYEIQREDSDGVRY